MLSDQCPYCDAEIDDDEIYRGYFCCDRMKEEILRDQENYLRGDER